MRAHDCLVWRGIPYAAPPVEGLRWRAPRPPEPWIETLDGSFRTEPAAQAIAFSDRAEAGRVEGELIGSEDCLYVTVWAPDVAPPADGWPVIVWFHGGGNVSGDGANIDAGQLAAKQQVVVVCVSHRLGLLGWFSHSALAGSDGSDEDRSGNYATLDHIAALHWVRDSISCFAGNPNCVTLLGQSSGGWNVKALVCSPLAKGLFHRAIIQSVGSYQLMTQAHGENFANNQDEPGHPQSANEILASLWLADGSIATAENAVQYFSEQRAEDIADYLRTQPVSNLIAASKATRRRNRSLLSAEAETKRASQVPPLFFCDGVVISEQVQSRVPIIVGATRDEDRAFLSSNPRFVRSLFGASLKRDIGRYERLANALKELFWSYAVHDTADAFTTLGMPVFVYRFDWDNFPPAAGVDVKQLLGACHGVELPFLFNSLELTRDVKAMEHLYDTNADEFGQLSSAMMQYWANFAADGDPGGGKSKLLPRWLPWDGNGYLVLDSLMGAGIRFLRDSRSGKESLRLLSETLAGLSVQQQQELIGDLRDFPTCRLTAKNFDALTAGIDEP